MSPFSAAHPSDEWHADPDPMPRPSESGLWNDRECPPVPRWFKALVVLFVAGGAVGVVAAVFVAAGRMIGAGR